MIRPSEHHPGITAHKLPVGGNVAGLIFVIGVLITFVFRVPLGWQFLCISVPLGLVIAVVLHFLHRRSKPPLSLKL
jgi:hypothetical protein